MEALEEMAGAECKKFSWEGEKKLSLSFTVYVKNTTLPPSPHLRGVELQPKASKGLFSCWVERVQDGKSSPMAKGDLGMILRVSG